MNTDKYKDFAVTMVGGVQVFLHELIRVSSNRSEIPDGYRVGFKNGNPLDCQRANLCLTQCLPGREYMGDRRMTNEMGLGHRSN